MTIEGSRPSKKEQKSRKVIQAAAIDVSMGRHAKTCMHMSSRYMLLMRIVLLKLAQMEPVTN